MGRKPHCHGSHPTDPRAQEGNVLVEQRYGIFYEGTRRCPAGRLPLPIDGNALGRDLAAPAPALLLKDEPWQLPGNAGDRCREREGLSIEARLPSRNEVSEKLYGGDFLVRREERRLELGNLEICGYQLLHRCWPRDRPICAHRRQVGIPQTGYSIRTPEHRVPSSTVLQGPCPALTSSCAFPILH